MLVDKQQCTCNTFRLLRPPAGRAGPSSAAMSFPHRWSAVNAGSHRSSLQTCNAREDPVPIAYSKLLMTASVMLGSTDVTTQPLNFNGQFLMHTQESNTFIGIELILMLSCVCMRNEDVAQQSEAPAKGAMLAEHRHSTGYALLSPLAS